MVRLPSRLQRADVSVWCRGGVPLLARVASNLIAIGVAAGTTFAIGVAAVTWPQSACAQQAQRVSLTVAPMTQDRKSVV